MSDDAVFLPIWTIYDHPQDYPDCFVARRFDIVRGEPEARPTGHALVAMSLDDLRGMLPPGLTRIPRFAEDEPQIVEVWL